MNEFRRHTDASISCCCMVQARKYIYLRICSLIFDTVDDCSRTGCGLETDRAWLTVSVSVCVRVRSSFPPSLSETERKGTQIKAVYFLLREREEKGEWAALLRPPLLPTANPLLPSWVPGSWMAQRGRRRKREDGWYSYVLCVNPSCFCPTSEVVCARLGFVSVSILDHWCPGFNRCGDSWAQQCLCFRVQKRF